MKLNYRSLNTPWATANDLYSPPGSLIVKLMLGEAPDDIPTAQDVRRGLREAVARLRIEVVDRVLQHFGERVRIVRVYTAASAIGKPGRGHERFDDLEHVIGLSRTFRIEAGRGVSVNQLVDALRQLAVIEVACPHYLTTLPFSQPRLQTLDASTSAYGWVARRQVNSPDALAYEPGDPAVIVAVVDTGVEYNHPELRDRLRSGLDTVQLAAGNMAASIKLVGDRAGVDTDPEDVVGHGTSCAAIIGARGDTLPPGLAGNCSVLPIRVLGAAMLPGKQEPVGIGALADIDQGVKAAIDLGAKVLNLSFGTPQSMLDPNDPLPHEDVVRYGLARNCILVAASGNSGKAEQFAPAALDGVIAVGAVGADGRPTAFTTSGDHLALCAPGERVLSASLDDGYQMVTGTSFAVPFVAAAAALLVSRAARRAYALDSPGARRLLCQTAARWPKDVPAGYGAGVLNVSAALAALDAEIDHMRLPGEVMRNGGREMAY